MAVSWLAPDDIRYAVDQLVAGTSFADIKTALAHVTGAFMDTQQAALTALAAQKKREFNPGTALELAALSQKVTPVFTSVTPATADISGGEVLVIVGTGFVEGCTVTIGGHAAAVLTVTPTELTVRTPAHAAEAGLAIVITNPAPASLADTEAAAFAFAKPVLAFTSITPATGSIDGGDIRAIVGTGFVHGMTVAIGGVDCRILSMSATRCTVKTPPHAAGAVNVVLLNKNTDTVTGAGAYTYA